MTSFDSADPLDELHRRARRADLLLLRAIRRQRARPSMRAKGQLWGTVITDDEVDELLVAHGEIEAPPQVDELPDALQASLALRDAPGGALGALRRRHQLSGEDMDLLLLALLPDLAEGYARIFAYLNDNLNLPFLTVGLASRVLATGRRERMGVLRRLLPQAPLVRGGLVELHPVHGLEYHASQRLLVERGLLVSLLSPDPGSSGLSVLGSASLQSPGEQVLAFPGEVGAAEE